MSLLDPNIKKYVFKQSPEFHFEDMDGNTLGIVKRTSSGYGLFPTNSKNFMVMKTKSGKFDDYGQENYFLKDATGKIFGQLKTLNWMGFQDLKFIGEDKDLVLKLGGWGRNEHKIEDKKRKTLATFREIKESDLEENHSDVKKQNYVLDILDTEFNRMILLSFFVFVIMVGPKFIHGH